VAPLRLGALRRSVGAGDELLGGLDGVPRRHAGGERLPGRRHRPESLDDRRRGVRAGGREQDDVLLAAVADQLVDAAQLRAPAVDDIPNFATGGVTIFIAAIDD
jgi:hypothetical protein